MQPCVRQFDLRLSVLRATYGWIRFATALVILLAIGLKLEAYFGDGGHPRSFLPFIELAAQWILTIWLLSGIASNWSAQALMVLLTVFICVSGWRFLTGRTDCGCFGNLHIRPAWTLGFDGILWCGFGLYTLRLHKLNRKLPAGKGRPSCSSARLFSASANAVLVPVVGFWIGAHLTSDNRRPVIINLEIGQRFPLLDYLSDSADRFDLLTGQKVIVLFDHDCSTCRAFLARLVDDQKKTASAAGIRTIDLGSRVIKESEESFSMPMAFRQIDLQPHIHYITPVPTQVMLLDGRISAIYRPNEHVLARTGPDPDDLEP